jgi:hypothetical protein
MTATVTVCIECETWDQAVDRTAEMRGKIVAAGGLVLETRTRADPPQAILIYYPAPAASDD